MYGYIYKTTNLVNGKIYIGQHKSNTFDTNYYGSGTILNKAIQKINDELDDASSQSNKTEPLRDEKGRFVSKRKNEKSKK